jgi:hypothetical protein
VARLSALATYVSAVLPVSVVSAFALCASLPIASPVSTVLAGAVFVPALAAAPVFLFLLALFSLLFLLILLCFLFLVHYVFFLKIDLV